MRWIIDAQEAEATLKEASDCVLPNAHPFQSEFEYLTFDCVEFHSRQFMSFLQQLMTLSSDTHFRYVVLNPDPINYFFNHFRKYPVFEMALGDSGDSYIEALTEDPGGSPADAVGSNWFEYVILPPSKKWCIHGIRDARSGEGGHIWVPRDWTDKVRAFYPYALH